MGDTGKDWLEAVLMKKSYEESPIKVVDIKTSDTSGVVTKGENYMSKIRRINAKVMLGSGKVKSMSFIVKNQHETEAMKKLSTDFGVFQREIAMYRDILVKMEGLLEDIDDCDGPFWPKCYDVRLYDRLIFEDLGVSGYAMVDRKNQQGLDSALLVLRHLAKFHALARILLDREEIPREPFGKSLYRITEQLSTSFTNGNVRSFAEMMETQWGNDWKDAVERLRQIDNIGDKYITSLEAQPEEFKTLCHGDCWTNNIMFKGDPEHPTSMKFVDFQLSYVSSPARDLVYFLSTSVRLEVRLKYTEQLLQAYCDALKTYLLKFNYRDQIPGLDDIKDSIRKRSIAPLCDSIALVPVVLGKKENAPDIEEVASKELKAAENGEESPGTWSNFGDLSPAAVAILQHEVKTALAGGFI